MSIQPSYQKPAYPFNWSQIALAAKQAAHWTCQICSIVQGEDPYNNITVHHKDHDTFHDDDDNLIVLCQKCHLRLEDIYRRRNHYYREINQKLQRGQRLLPGFSEPMFIQLNKLSYASPRLATGSDV